jgi:hypothetical protein
LKVKKVLNMNTSIYLALMFVLTAQSAVASDLPVRPLIKQGACPSGYTTNANYCKPGTGARFALPKQGSCPSGYASSGSYCLAGASARYAIAKSGSCPSGYASSGGYCLKSE